MFQSFYKMMVYIICIIPIHIISKTPKLIPIIKKRRILNPCLYFLSTRIFKFFLSLFISNILLLYIYFFIFLKIFSIIVARLLFLSLLRLETKLISRSNLVSSSEALWPYGSCNCFVVIIVIMLCAPPSSICRLVHFLYQGLRLIDTPKTVWDCAYYVIHT